MKKHLGKTLALLFTFALVGQYSEATVIRSCRACSDGVRERLVTKVYDNDTGILVSQSVGGCSYSCSEY